jgi:hypothetical protein
MTPHVVLGDQHEQWPRVLCGLGKAGEAANTGSSLGKD